MLKRIYRGLAVHYYSDNDKEPSHAVIASIDYGNTDDNARPRVNLVVLLAGLCKWTSRFSVQMVSDDHEESKHGRWAFIDL